jgi:predicted  nucleic acid-binding Zn ribbon protein
MGYSNLHEDAQENCPSCNKEHTVSQNFQGSRCYDCRLQEIEAEQNTL